jgi:hypothetical protein
VGRLDPAGPFRRERLVVTMAGAGTTRERRIVWRAGPPGPAAFTAGRSTGRSTVVGVTQGGSPMAGYAIPARRGDPPVVSGPTPHEQVTQTAPVELQDLVIKLVSALPGVEVGPSYVDVEGTRAFHLSPALARGPREAFLAATEFAHVHPGYDGSLHLALPTHLALAVEEAGWGERHPQSGALLLFGPRDTTESDLIWRLLRVSYRYALGEGDPASEWH